MRGWWYNGNTARLGRGRAAEKSIGNFAQKKDLTFSVKSFYLPVSKNVALAHDLFTQTATTLKHSLTAYDRSCAILCDYSRSFCIGGGDREHLAIDTNRDVGILLILALCHFDYLFLHFVVFIVSRSTGFVKGFGKIF
jgi:hypothetical protein